MKKVTELFIDIISRCSRWLEVIAGIALVAIMVLTGCDIVGRVFGRPIQGTYEIVSFAGGLVIGLAMPITSLARGHVIVDLITARIPPQVSKVLYVITRLMGILMFLMMCYAFIKMGSQLKAAGEVTPVLSLNFYLVAYLMAGACFVESLILAGDIIRGGGYTHE